MFEPPFSQVVVASSIIGIVGGGVGIVCFACYFQNKKHGFIK
jgi:hypothetical protein